MSDDETGRRGSGTQAGKPAPWASLMLAIVPALAAKMFGLSQAAILTTFVVALGIVHLLGRLLRSSPATRNESTD